IEHGMRWLVGEPGAAQILDVQKEIRNRRRELDAALVPHDPRESGGTPSHLVAEVEGPKIAPAGQSEVEVVPCGFQVGDVARRLEELRQKSDGVADHEVCLIGFFYPYDVEGGCGLRDVTDQVAPVIQAE